MNIHTVQVKSSSTSTDALIIQCDTALHIRCPSEIIANKLRLEHIPGAGRWLPFSLYCGREAQRRMPIGGTGDAGMGGRGDIATGRFHMTTGGFQGTRGAPKLWFPAPLLLPCAGASLLCTSIPDCGCDLKLDGGDLGASPLGRQ